MTPVVPLRVRIKNNLKHILPESFFQTILFLWRATISKTGIIGDQDILARYEKIFIKKYPKVTQAGPFKGMRYVDMAVGSSYLQKLTGSYEAILHPIIEKITKQYFDTIIDIGSAEGYYLVGLGMKIPNAHLIGFEVEEKGRSLTKELSEINNIKNKITLLGEATASNLETYITKDTLLICDCEGAEMDILNPEINHRLVDIKMAIIELHDFIRPKIKETLLVRFEKTHKIQIIPFTFANPEDYPFFNEVKNKKDLYELLRERGCQEQEWMILERK